MTTLCVNPTESPSIQLTALLGAGKSKLIRAGTEIAAQSEEQISLYYIVRGWSLRYRALPDGRRHIVGVALPGEFALTEACLYKVASHGVIAVTELQAMVFPAETLTRIVGENPAAARLLLCSQAHEYSMAVEHLLSVGRRSAYERVIHFLLELWHRLREIGLAREATFDMPLTQEIIADTLGLSIIHVNRTMQRLRRDRLFEITSGQPARVTVVNAEAAIALSNFDPEYLRARQIAV